MIKLRAFNHKMHLDGGLLLKGKIQTTQSLSLPEIFEQVSIDTYLINFEDKGLIRNLLLNGYLNENFEDYISLFHEVNLTKDDMSFDRQLKSGSQTIFTQKLSKIDNLIKRLPHKYFQRPNILNYDLTDYLLVNHNKYSDLFDSYFAVLTQENEHCFSFICGYIEQKSTNLGEFMRCLLNKMLTFWAYLNEISGLPDEIKRALLLEVLENASLNEILQQHKFETLQEYFESMPDFTTFSGKLKNEQTLRELMRKKNFQFKNLEKPISTDIWFDYIFGNNLYLLNLINIRSIIEYSSADVNTLSFYTANYTTLIKSNIADLLYYIHQNIESYIGNVLLQNDNTDESIESIVHILNNASVSVEIKQQFLAHQKKTIADLNEISDKETRKMALDINRVDATWENVYHYFKLNEEETIDVTLRSFLTNRHNYEELANLAINDSRKLLPSEQKTIINIIIYETTFNNEVYKFLVKGFPKDFIIEYPERLPTDKVQLLIENKVVAFSEPNFRVLKQNFPNLHIYLLENHELAFSKGFQSFLLGSDDINLVMRSLTLNINTKLHILNTMDDGLIIDNSSLADICCSLYADQPYVSLRFEVLLAMIRHNNSIAKRIQLLMKHIHNTDNEQIITLTSALGKEYNNIFSEQSTTIPGDDHQYKYFETLLIKGVIKNISYKKDKTIIIRSYFKEAE